MTRWTTNTLRKHLAAQIDALRTTIADLERHNVERFSAAKERVDLALASADKASMRADAAIDKRFDGVNELRGALSDQAALMLPRTEYSSQHQSLIEKIDAVRERVAALESVKRGSGASLATVMQVITAAASLAAVIGVIAVVVRGH